MTFFFTPSFYIVFAYISQGARPFGARWAGPPLLFFRVEILKKFTGKSAPENYIFFEKNVFHHFSPKNALKPI